jgi:hypothetical protein
MACGPKRLAVSGDHDTASPIRPAGYLNVTTIDDHPKAGLMLIVELNVPALLTMRSCEASLPAKFCNRFPKPEPAVNVAVLDAVPKPMINSLAAVVDAVPLFKKALDPSASISVTANAADNVGPCSEPG